MDPARRRIDWALWRDRAIVAVAITAVAGVTASVLARILHTLLLLALAIVLAYAMEPVLAALDRILPRGIAALGSYLVGIAVIGVVAFLLLHPLIAQATTLGKDAPTYFDRAERSLNAFAAHFGVALPSADQARGTLLGQVQGAARTVLLEAVGALTKVANVIVDVVVVLVLGFWFMVDGRRLADAGLRLVPEAYRSRVLFVENTVSAVLGAYIRGQLTMALIIGVSSGLGCWALGVPYPAVIGFLAFFFELLPMVGPILASLPAILIAAFQSSTLLGMPLVLPVIAFFVLMQFSENNILGPRITGHAVGVHPVAALIALLLGAEVAGIWGALFAVPIIGVASVLTTAGLKAWRGEPVVVRRGDMTFRMPRLGRRRPKPAS